MRGLRDLLLEEQFRLENTINKVKDRLKQAPEGNLRLSKSHNHVQYYCCKEENKTETYRTNGIRIFSDYRYYPNKLIYNKIYNSLNCLKE